MLSSRCAGEPVPHHVMSERKGEKEEAEEEDTRRKTGAKQKPNKIRGTDVREKDQPDGNDPETRSGER